MVKTSKLLALIGAILSILGSFFFTLYTNVNSVYGVGALLSIGTAFSLALSWVHYVLIFAFIIFLLASIAQIFGIPSSIAAIIGGTITLIFCIFIILGVYGVFSAFTIQTGFLFDHIDWIPGIIPINVNIAGVGLGTYIAAVGGILSLVSGFMSRE